MSTTRYYEPGAVRRGHPPAALRRVRVFAALGAVLLLLQVPLGSLHLPAAWDCLFLLGLIHCVVMLVDSACTHLLRHRTVRAGSLVSCLLPAERRGISQLLTLAAMILAMLAATGLHDD